MQLFGNPVAKELNEHFGGRTRFPLPSDGRGMKGEGTAREFYSALRLFRALSLTPALSHPMGEGETLGRARQRSHVCGCSLETKTKSSFVGLCGWLSAQPRSVDGASIPADAIEPLRRIHRIQQGDVCRLRDRAKIL